MVTHMPNMIYYRPTTVHRYRRWIMFLAPLALLLALICALQAAEIREYRHMTIQPKATLSTMTMSDKPCKTYDAGPMQTEPLEPEITAISLGMFTCYAYCPCQTCTGHAPDSPAYGITYSGTVATQGRTVAVDPDVIPLGSLILVDGVPYIAEDTGNSHIQGNAIDIFFAELTQAENYGVQQHEVWIVQEVGQE